RLLLRLVLMPQQQGWLLAREHPALRSVQPLLPRRLATTTMQSLLMLPVGWLLLPAFKMRS
ncbi:TPA: hypothetical protein ACQTYN_006356, partial [Pseudomonas aeruginosa]